MDRQPPKIGPTGSPVVTWSMTATSSPERIEYAPPSPPMREAYELDDDGHIVRLWELSDAEFEAAKTEYAARLKRWNTTGGVEFLAGRLTVEVSVKCEDGAEADGVWDGSGWRWVHQWSAD